MAQSYLDDVIDVLEETRRVFGASARFISADELRRDATRSVAERWLATKRFKNQNSAERTIHDALIRRLNPDVRNTADFDGLIDHWIRGRPEALRKLLTARARSESQKRRIAGLFDGDAGRRPRDRRAEGSADIPVGREKARSKPRTVQLDPDVENFFPDSESVNEALRALIPIIRRGSGG